MGLDKDIAVSRIGTGGSNEPLRISTHGQDRFEVEANSPALKGKAAPLSPPAPTQPGEGSLFFRNDGAGKSQMCVRFPSGAVQILASEP